MFEIGRFTTGFRDRAFLFDSDDIESFLILVKDLEK